MRSTSVASALSFMRRSPYTGPNIPGYWSRVIKVYKKGGSTTKRQWFSELSPQFRRGDKFKSPQEGRNENETRGETALGRTRLEGWRVAEGVGDVGGTGSPGGWWGWWWCMDSDFLVCVRRLPSKTLGPLTYFGNTHFINAFLRWHIELQFPCGFRRSTISVNISCH